MIDLARPVDFLAQPSPDYFIELISMSRPCAHVCMEHPELPEQMCLSVFALSRLIHRLTDMNLRKFLLFRYLWHWENGTFHTMSWIKERRLVLVVLAPYTSELQCILLWGIWFVCYCCTRLFKPPPPVGAAGRRRRRLYVFGSSVHAAVRACVRPWFTW